LCREEAVEFSKVIPEFSAINVRVVVVVKERIGVDDFRAFWKGEIYLDEPRTFYKRVLGDRTAGLSSLFSSRVRANLARAKAKNVKGNLLTGEGLLKGGLVLVSPEPGAGVVYEFREDEFGDLANPLVVLAEAKLLKPVPSLAPVALPAPAPGPAAPALPAPTPAPVSPSGAAAAAAGSGEHGSGGGAARVCTSEECTLD